MSPAASERRLAVIDEVVARLRDDVALRSWAGGSPDFRVDWVAARRSSHVARVEVRFPHGTRRLVVKVPRLRPGKTDKTLTTLSSVQRLPPGRSSRRLPARRDWRHRNDRVFPRDPGAVWNEVAGESLDAMARRATPGLPGAARLESLSARATPARGFGSFRLRRQWREGLYRWTILSSTWTCG